MITINITLDTENNKSFVKYFESENNQQGFTTETLEELAYYATTLLEDVSNVDRQTIISTK
jgi:hypothetical protein|nr:MAG TPA: hypothetical protein [Caudoviricetes sp.]